MLHFREWYEGFLLSLLKVAPDKTYLINEERIRFTAPADMDPRLVPMFAFKTIAQAKDIYEKHRGWRFLDAVPARREFPGGKPCCTDMVSKKVGEPLTIKFMPSDYQGDTDDAHNFGELSNKQHRITVENIIDWVAIMHFWEPAIVVNLDEEKENRLALSTDEGFATWDSMPTNAWTALKKRFENK